MRQASPWTPEADYALAFGAGLSLSNARIAQMMGPSFTRNSVIGRRHRLGIKDEGWRPPQPKKPKAPKQVPSRNGNVVVRHNAWRAEEDQIILANQDKVADELLPLLPGRTAGAIHTRRNGLGVRKWRKFVFTPEIDAHIRQRYLAHVAIETIAQECGHPSPNGFKQRIKVLGLTRDARKTALANRFGLDVLTLSDDPVEIRRTLLARETEQQQRIEAERQSKVNLALDLMMDALALGNDRRMEMQVAMLAGATLQEIGDRLGITRERVRQVVHEIKSTYRPKPARKLVCRECDGTFVFRGQGNPHYCEPCRPIVAERRRQEGIAYHRAFRASKEGKKYRREWTRRSRVKEKLLQLDNTALAQVLRDVAKTLTGDAKI